MKVCDIINFNRELLLKIGCFGIKPSDIQYIDLYNEYESMHSVGEKVTYIVASLSEKYNISERKIYYLIKLFNKDCNTNAV